MTRLAHGTAVAFPPGHVDGLQMLYNAVDLIDIVKGSCRDSTDTFNIVVPADLDCSMAASGAGGLDTGSEASDTWYAVYVIADTTGASAPAIVYSASFTAPTLPGTYDVFRRIGSVRNDSGSSIVEFSVIEGGNSRSRRYAIIGTPTIQTAIGSTQTISVAAFVPPPGTMLGIYYSFSTSFAQNGVTFYREPAQTHLTYQFLAHAATANARDTREIAVDHPTKQIRYVENGSDVVLDLYWTGWREDV